MKEVEAEVDKVDEEQQENPYKNIDFFIHRPVFAEPPLCTIAELNTSITLLDVLSMHDILDFKKKIKEEMNDQQVN